MSYRFVAAAIATRFCLLILALSVSVCLGTTSASEAADADCDTIEDSVDNCPARFNPGQGDLDADLAGDACDLDKDADGAANADDNCVRHSNAGQEDADVDGAGDACDVCADTPGVDVANRRGCSVDQLCACSGPGPDQAWRDNDQYRRCVKRKVRHFRRQRLLDRDQAGEILDAASTNGCGNLTPQPGDNDGDTVADGDDNCPSDSNPSQSDTDQDGFGNACDSDKDDDSVLNKDDNCPLVANGDGQALDADGDGTGDACDLCTGTGLEATTDRDGCSIDQHCPCDADVDGNPWAGRGKYRACVADEVFRLRQARILSQEDAEAIRAAAAASTCGVRPLVCE